MTRPLLVVVLAWVVALGCTREIVALDTLADDTQCFSPDGAPVCDGGSCDAAAKCFDSD